MKIYYPRITRLGRRALNFHSPHPAFVQGANQ